MNKNLYNMDMHDICGFKYEEYWLNVADFSVCH